MRQTHVLGTSRALPQCIVKTYHQRLAAEDSENVDATDLLLPGTRDSQDLRNDQRPGLRAFPEKTEFKPAALSETKWTALPRRLFSCLMAILIPSFLHSASKLGTSSKPKPPQPTAWLDGLRGYAALIVCFFHFSFAYWSGLRFVYGTLLPQGTPVPKGDWYPTNTERADGSEILTITRSDPLSNLNLLQLPIVRCFYLGDPMVCIFFIVSGYALSAKPIKLIRRGAAGRSQLLATLASTTFRRPIRLLIPCVVSTFCVLVAVRLGIYNYADKFAGEESGGATKFHEHFQGYAYEATPYIADTLWEQLKEWSLSLYDLMDFFTHYHWTMSRYDIHLWTIPVEFKCSLLLFATSAGTALLQPRARLIILALFILLGMTWGDTWELSLFLAGMFLCETDTIRHEQITSSQTSNPAAVVTSTPKRFRKRWILALFTALYLLSYPRHFANFTPCYSALSRLHIPGLRPSAQFRFWQGCGAVLLVATVSHSPLLKTFFSNRAARYLGRISYALYLVHGPVFRSLGYSLVFRLWCLIGERTKVEYNTAVILGGLVTIPTVVYVADVFCRVVDEPVVRFAKWMENWLVGTGGHLDLFDAVLPSTELEMEPLTGRASPPLSALDEVETQSSLVLPGPAGRYSGLSSIV